MSTDSPLVFLFAAFAVVWIALFLYILYLDRQTRTVSAHLRELYSRLAEISREAEKVDQRTDQG